MSWFKLKKPMATNVTADVMDTINTKMALNQLGFYERPANGVFGDWVDNQVFDGIRKFQRDSGLMVDGYMKPDGPTETAINHSLASPIFRTADLGSLEDPSMCGCMASDDNPWPSS